MDEQVQVTPETGAEEAAQEQALTPAAFLKQFKNAPNEAQIADIKSKSPGGRLRLITSSDGARVYILRAISAHELQTLQEGILKTVAPERYASALKTELAAKCCVWTSATPTGSLTSIELKGSGAGLVDTLHEVISELSDYMETPQIKQFSADL